MEASPSAAILQKSKEALGALSGKRLPHDDLELEAAAARTLQCNYRGYKARQQLLAQLDAELLALEQENAKDAVAAAAATATAAAVNPRPPLARSTSPAAPANVAQSLADDAERELRAVVRIQSWRRGVNSRRAWWSQMELEAQQLEEAEEEAVNPEAAVVRLKNENAELQRQLAAAQSEAQQLREQLALHLASGSTAAATVGGGEDAGGAAAKAQGLRQQRMLLQQEQLSAAGSGAAPSDGGTKQAGPPDLSSDTQAEHAAVRIQRALRSRRPCAKTRAHQADLQAMLRSCAAQLTAKERCAALSLQIVCVALPCLARAPCHLSSFS